MRTRTTAWTPAPPTVADADPAERAERLAELIAGRRVVALTGAGLSTPSGIPDYRSPDSPTRQPMTIDAFLSSPESRRRYWARNHLGWRHMDAAAPNAAHRALRSLQDAGVVTGVITQNVDMLHMKAGSSPVVDLHGSYGRVRCLDCGALVSRHRLAEALEIANPGYSARVASRGAIEVAPDADAALEDIGDFVMLDCTVCGGTLKPDIVYFGETVEKSVVETAFALVDDADVLLVAGSSLTVMSGLRFVRRAAAAGKPIAIVNRGGTRGDDLATLKIDHRCEVILPTVARVIGPDRSALL
ncbi:Sir2 family NAD-dependent protein deacetylase [Gordonia neofelifaecis]|uniref:NAD-dependent protein deacetylase n=1 Tax=Gordonia neofelifaecis NRRL B-59395 TaxID=644548 RepID=F1YI67_9ACTN|nr:Sir2 family NAD-dependent protein deacetylase [Gordonia neofelifaecis]EGD55621.1 Silent information regulator protein Sir2 [Gordonia neofelifaecis NRRL B-59395]